MDKKLKSIVEEIGNYVPMKDRELFIEARAKQAVASVANLINLIKETYDDDTADDLQRRLMNSIKANDSGKFTRKINQIRESKKKGPQS